MNAKTTQYILDTSRYNALFYLIIQKIVDICKEISIYF